ncbi:MAG: hypothetical protein ACLUOI_13090 [Eisenbergiella sp.]
MKKVEEKVITTAGGEVTAEHIIFAGHFPFLNKPGYYFARMHQERSYCLALSSVREYEGDVLWGGRKAVLPGIIP